jgi:uncharacterized protein (TIRG00374 family)
MRLSKHAAKKFAVYLIAAGCIAWVLKGVHFNELLSHLRVMNPWWIAGAVTLDVITTVLHGFRWKLLLQPSGNLSLLRAVQAIYSCLFSNEILPLKAGEFVRGYVVSRWLSTPLSAILPSMVTERIFDGSLLVIGFAISIRFVSMPAGVAKAAWIVGAIMLLVITALLVLAFRGEKPASTQSSDRTGRRGPAEHISAFCSHFAEGMRALRNSAHFAAVTALSFLYLFTQVMAYWMIMKAYGLHLSLWTAAVVLIIVRLGSAVPSAPANIGPYQFFCVLALTLFGIDKTTATGFAVALWLIFSIPILILGFAAFLGSGLSLSDLKQRERSG